MVCCGCGVAARVAQVAELPPRDAGELLLDAEVPATMPDAAVSCPETLAKRLSITQVDLSADIRYRRPGYMGFPFDERVSISFAPDGTAYAAWTDTAATPHVTPLTATLTRRAPDITVNGQEHGGIAAREDGFAILTTRTDPGEQLSVVPDANIIARAIMLVRFRGTSEVFASPLTGTASVTHNADPTARDGSPGYLYSRLAWNGAKYGSYFIVRACAGDPHNYRYGDKLVYVDDNGGGLRGGWSWMCSADQGLRMWPEPDVFTPVCFSDAAPYAGLNLVIEDRAPALLAPEAADPNLGWSGGQFGSIVKFASGTYVIGWLSRDTTSMSTVAARRASDIAMLRLGPELAPLGQKRWLVETPNVAETNLHFAAYGSSRLLMIWDSMEDLRCNATVCFGTYTGTHARLLDLDGNFLTPDALINPVPNTAEDLIALPNGDVVWAYVPDDGRNYSQPLDTDAVTRLPAKRKLFVARLRMCE